MKHEITNQRALRAAFWRDHPDAERKKLQRRSYMSPDYKTDTRVAFVDYVDRLQRDGIISADLAAKATL